MGKKINLVNSKGKNLAKVSPKTSEKASVEAERRQSADDRKQGKEG